MTNAKDTQHSKHSKHSAGNSLYYTETTQHSGYVEMTHHSQPKTQKPRQTRGTPKPSKRF